MDLTGDLKEHFMEEVMNPTRPRPVPKNKPEANLRLAAFATEHATCAMCETQLDIRFETNRSDLRVKEEAHCPCCGIRVRSGHYLMH